MTFRLISQALTHPFAVGSLSLVLLGGLRPGRLTAQVKPAATDHHVAIADDAERVRFVQISCKK